MLTRMYRRQRITVLQLADLDAAFVPLFFSCIFHFAWSRPIDKISSWLGKMCGSVEEYNMSVK